MKKEDFLIITPRGNLTKNDFESYQLDVPFELNTKLPFLHRAQNNIEFILRFWWLYKNNHPQAILPEKVSGSDLHRIQQQLGKHYFYEDKLIHVSSQEDNNIHPQTSIILFTSGSSGGTKAVQLSKDNILANTNAVSKTLDLHLVKNQILFLPLHYSFGLLGQLVPAIELNICTYLFNHLLESKNIIPLHQDCLISGVPQHYQTLSKLFPSDKFTNITHVVSAGAYWSIQDRMDAQKLFPNAILYNNYGQTELSPRALNISSKDPAFFKGVTGRVVPGLTSKINDEGELLFKGKQVMLGYINDDNTSQERSDQWWFTGDHAKEEDGIITVLGRKDDILKINGERTSLFFINNRIKEIATVIEAITLNEIEAQQDISLMTFIVPAKNFDLQDFKKRLTEKLLPGFIPKKIFCIEQLPLLSNGKVDRQKLKSDASYRTKSVL